MRKHVRYAFKLLAVTLCMAMLTGCWSRHELNSLSITLGVGMDAEIESNTKQITLQIANVQEIKTPQSSSGASGKKAYWNVSGSAQDVFGIRSQLNSKVSQRAFLAHTQVLIYGTDAAEQGIDAFSDYFMRQNNSRFTVLVLVAKGKASELLDVQQPTESIPSISITHLVQSQMQLSHTIPVRLFDLMTRMMSNTTAPIAPIIEVAQDGDKSSIQISGMAVFKEKKMIGALDKDQTKGLIYVLGKVNNGFLSADIAGSRLSFQIISAKTKVRTTVNPDGSVGIQIKVDVQCGMDGEIGDVDVTASEQVTEMEQAIARTITDMMQSSLTQAQALHADVFGFGDMIRQKHPRAWKQIKDQWDELFSTLQPEYEVTVKVRSVGSIAKPILPVKEK